MVKKLFYDLFAKRDLEHAKRRLRWLEQKLPTPELRFAVPPSFQGRRHFKTMKIMQHGGEILALYEILLAERPRRVLEVGTARGGTLYLWTQAATDDARIVSIDLPDGPFGGGYPACRVPFYEAFCRSQQTLHLLRTSSLDRELPTRVHELLDEKPIDFLFIDADHTYEAARTNFELYSPLVRPGGLIALHDILPNPRDRRIEVWRLWEELKHRPDSRELIGDENAGRPLGLGLLRAGEPTGAGGEARSADLRPSSDTVS